MSRRPMRRTAALLAGLSAALLATAGCADIPTSSKPQVISESLPTTSAPDEDDFRYDEIVPRPGEDPEEIVRDFLAAGGSSDRSHARARAYLTPAAASEWDDTKGARILESNTSFYTTGGGTQVQMIARQQGRLDDDGSYVPGEAQAPYTFRLKKVNGNWRIDNPAPGLQIEVTTFEDAYRPYDVYFLDSTRTRVVPDVRWYAASQDTLPSILVTAIENGPSSWLADGVKSDLTGLTLQNNIEQDRDRVKVYLGGLDDQSDNLSPGAYAQLVWTLNQLGVGGVEVYADNRLLVPKNTPGRPLQQFSDWRSYSPDGLRAAAAGYFIRDGAVWSTQDQAVPGSAGRSSFQALSVGIATNEQSLAVVRRSAGRQVLYVGGFGSLRGTITGTTLTRPSWGPETREVWTVRNGREVLVVPISGREVRVDVPSLDSIGPIRALAVSRDGSRVALAAGRAGDERLWIGVISREDDLPRIDNLRMLDAGDTPVTDVSWADSSSVIALTRGGGQDSSLYSINIDGASDSQLVATGGLPEPPAAVAAGPSLPLLTIATKSLYRAPATDQNWTKAFPHRGIDSAPVYPG